MIGGRAVAAQRAGHVAAVSPATVACHLRFLSYRGEIGTGLPTRWGAIQASVGYRSARRHRVGFQVRISHRRDCGATERLAIGATVRRPQFGHRPSNAHEPGGLVAQLPAAQYRQRVTPHAPIAMGRNASHGCPGARADASAGLPRRRLPLGAGSPGNTDLTFMRATLNRR